MTAKRHWKIKLPELPSCGDGRMIYYVIEETPRAAAESVRQRFVTGNADDWVPSRFEVTPMSGDSRETIKIGIPRR